MIGTPYDLRTTGLKLNNSFLWETNLSHFYYNPKSEKVGTVWKTQIKKESSDF